MNKKIKASVKSCNGWKFYKEWIEQLKSVGEIKTNCELISW